MTRLVRIGASKAKVLLWRLHQALSYPGWIGLALCALAGVIWLQAWRDLRRSDLVERGMPLAAPVALGAPVEAGPKPVQLPLVSEVPLLLQRLERTAVEHSLGWPRADYRLHAPTDGAPAMLEVKCAFDAPYLHIRRFVSALLLDIPALTLREFSVSRPSAEAGNVQAKLTIVVFLSGDVMEAHP
jgi:hypothetical protein